MKPINNLVNPLLTDMYQLSMAYAYWKNGRHNEEAVFDLFFRKNPFGGEFTVFAGLEEVLRFLDNFKFTDEDISYLKTVMSTCEQGFFDWLKTVDSSHLDIYAVAEGTIVFPHVPLLIIEGPLAVCQLLETTLLNLVNYPTLIATNAARFRLAAGEGKILLEFGLRRAQGPDGGISASRYSYIGGFDGTSNVLAGKIFGIPIKGTHAHAFVQSFSSLKDIKNPTIKNAKGVECNFVELVLTFRQELNLTDTNEGELAAFISYAQAFPNGFLALVDTYDTLKSGVPNFICVALALKELGYEPVGVRIDSGDLAFLSKKTRQEFRAIDSQYTPQFKMMILEANGKINEYYKLGFERLAIVASNDINEEIIVSLQQQGHEIDTFGIGTNLVTCQKQPALGGVYKLVEINGQPRIKLSEDAVKITIPGRKFAYRLIGQDGLPLIDVLVREDKRPKAGERFLCRHPFNQTKRAYVVPKEVISLHECVWRGKRYFSPPDYYPTIHNIRSYVMKQLVCMRQDHLRLLNPTPYKIAVSEGLYNFIHQLMDDEAPIAELK